MANSAFSPSVLTIAAAATANVGELNIVTNASASTDTTGWTASGLTLTRDATGSPLDPVVPTGFNLSASATSQTFTSSALTVPSTLRNKKLKLEFYYSYTSGSSFTVDVLDGSDVEYALTTDVSGATTLAQMTGKFVCYFDSNNTSTCKVKLTSTGSGAMKITQIIVGPGIQPQGAVVGEWQSYTPILTATTSNPTTSSSVGKYRRVGSQVEVQVNFVITAYGSGTYKISFPSGLSVDFNSMSTSSGDTIGQGNGYISTNTGGTRIEVVPGFNTSVGNFAVIYGYNSAVITHTTFSGASSSLLVAFFAPISEWSGSGTVQLAQNDVEFISYDGTNAIYGPQGSVVPNVSVSTTYTMNLQTPVQASGGWVLEFKTPNSDGFYPLPIINSAENQLVSNYYYDGTANRGSMLETSSNSQIKVIFAPTPANGQTWSNLNSAGWRWRIRKISAGAAVGFGVVNSVSTGLVTPMTAQTALTASASPTATITRAVGIAYTDIGGVWRLRFNIMWTVASGTRTSATLTLSGVTFKNVTNLAQAISVTSNVGASAYQQGYVNPNTGVITVEHASATTTSYYVSGDVELESKPTWA